LRLVKSVGSLGGQKMHEKTEGRASVGEKFHCHQQKFIRTGKRDTKCWGGGRLNVGAGFRSSKLPGEAKSK